MIDEREVDEATLLVGDTIVLVGGVTPREYLGYGTWELVPCVEEDHCDKQLH
tara:strand:+ start:433 stop:588 length:156 start_codon:yes stop_codon:yes gene_type:complete